MRKPDFECEERAAWIFDNEKLRARPVPPERRALFDAQMECQINTALIHWPGAHAFWEYWFVSMVELKNVPGLPEAKLQFPEAKFELQVLALNPDKFPADFRKKDIVLEEHDGGSAMLLPPDLIYQFGGEGIGREHAKQLFELYVRYAVDYLPPDADYASEWKRRLDDTVAHWRAGKHPIQ